MLITDAEYALGLDMVEDDGMVGIVGLRAVE